MNVVNVYVNVVSRQKSSGDMWCLGRKVVVLVWKAILVCGWRSPVVVLAVSCFCFLLFCASIYLSPSYQPSVPRPCSGACFGSARAPAVF